MKSERLLIILTAVNLGLLGYQVFQPQLAGAATADVPAVLRGHALEIVDARGKVRASLVVIPEDPKVIWKGKPYPETAFDDCRGRGACEARRVSERRRTGDRRGVGNIYPSAGRSRREHAKVDKQRRH